MKAGRTASLGRQGRLPLPPHPEHLDRGDDARNVAFTQRHDREFVPECCVLVQDDLDLSLGSVRTRLSGGGGGHRGVVSILEAFQTDAFRRVKIGVGQEGAKANRVEYVLSAFDAKSRSTIDPAIAAAAARALELVERFSLAKQE